MNQTINLQASDVRWVVMGVSGCGKSTVGKALALALNVPFVEGDEYHPEANVIKMSAGFALTDTDRAEWLATLTTQIRAAKHNGTGLVVSCSALKRRYRDLLREGDAQLRFAHLRGDKAIISERMQARVGHYMPPSLLDSQLRDLEALQDDEAGISLHIGTAPAQLVEQILARS